MVKFCLQCKNAFWGGQYCPKCPGEIELLDAALPENKKYLQTKRDKLGHFILDED